jgi:hypothetical protein
MFKLEGETPTMVLDPERRKAIVDALAEMLLEAGRPARRSRSACNAGGQDDDESQDHG